MKVLLFSTLYPSAVRPIHGIFVETRLRELLKTGEVQAKVVAPVPWFPSKAQRFGEYAQFAATPRFEHRNGLDVHHPRYLLLPKVGMNLAPWTMALGALPTVRRLQREGFDFDVIDAHYYYPDGVAAGLLAKWLGKPFVVTARGSDINVIAGYPIPRRLMRNTMRRASASIGVCQALTAQMQEIGGDGLRLHTLRNGVDLEKFSPQPMIEARQRLGLDVSRRYLLMVGRVVELKEHRVAIEALPRLPDANLVIVGTGPEEDGLKALALRLGVADRVRWAGAVPQAELKWWYSAADALALCSRHEGWPNVLLESMACGTPVLSTAVSGTPDIVTANDAGRLLTNRSSDALVSAWRDLAGSKPDREATRRHAEGFSWQETSQSQFELFRSIIGTLASPSLRS